MEQPRILAVDDNPEIREIIQILLSGEGFLVEEAADGNEALARIKEHRYDLIILDIMMPGPNGYQTCLEIRKCSNAPILFLSARTRDSDKTLGFSSGGDDYLAKPFSYSELVSRARALIRRYQVYQGKETPLRKTPTPPPVFSFHEYQIDEGMRRVAKDGAEIGLTDTEFEMLLVLARNRRQVFSAQRLYEAVWDEPYYYGANSTVMVHIRNLRKKIEPDPKNPRYIQTVWGKGYRCD